MKTIIENNAKIKIVLYLLRVSVRSKSSRAYLKLFIGVARYEGSVLERRWFVAGVELYAVEEHKSWTELVLLLTLVLFPYMKMFPHPNIFYVFYNTYGLIPLERLSPQLYGFLTFSGGKRKGTLGTNGLIKLNYSPRQNYQFSCLSAKSFKVALKF